MMSIPYNTLSIHLAVKLWTKNIDCHHKGKNKWIVTYETLHPSSGWISGKNEINPSISGFSTIGGTSDITWH